MQTILNIITWLRGLFSRKRPDVSPQGGGGPGEPQE